MKVFLLAPREDWICDRFVSEWYEHNPDISTRNPYEADIIWLLADWAWNQVPYEVLRQKRVITSIHHITPEKFGPREQADFLARDAITDLYHVPCGHTEKQVAGILGNLGLLKPVICRPFWVNDKLWAVRENEQNLRAQYQAGEPDSFLVGSFQRDTEGNDLISPKLEKGPDLFCNMVELLHTNNPKTRVVLGGWRRQYVQRRLEAANIPYRYLERPNLDVIRDLYKMLNLYVVAARYEGGPQSIVECAALCVPIVSTDVGLAPEILHPNSIFDPSYPGTFEDAVVNAQSPDAMAFAYRKVAEHFLEPSFVWYRNLLNEMMTKGIAK